MREIINFSNKEIIPSQNKIYEIQQIPANAKSTKKIAPLIEDTKKIFMDLSKPVGLISSIKIHEFEKVYYGLGLNAPETPVDKIFRKGTALSIFAVTLGNKFSKKISDLFSTKEFALAYMLDAIASEAIDQAAELLQGYFHKYLTDKELVPPGAKVLRYSPGYCGWHISGQKHLLEALKPSKIGVRFNESYLMEPLKSISGVLIAGPEEIHKIQSTYIFCKTCATKSCQKRFANLKGKKKENKRMKYNN